MMPRTICGFIGLLLVSAGFGCGENAAASKPARSLSAQFPTAYSLTRPELQNNPGALVAGDDWQSYSSSAEVAAEFTHEAGWGTTPVQCGTVNLVADSVFGQVPQGQHNDGSTSCKPNEVRYAKTFSGVERAWIRITFKVEANYESNSFWKFLWAGSETDGTPIRHLAFAPAGGFIVDFHTQGGTECGAVNASCPTLDASAIPDNGDPDRMGEPTSVITDREWWEYIFCQEVLRGAGTGGKDIYRVRMWQRPLTSENGRSFSAKVPAMGPGGYTHRRGLESYGAAVATDFIDQVWLGVTRNDPTSPGHTNYFRWGPWEIINADVIADPYNLGADMLR